MKLEWTDSEEGFDLEMRILCNVAVGDCTCNAGECNRK